MLINFLNEYYKSRSIDQNQTELVNMYLEIQNQEVQAAYNKGGLQSQAGKYKVTAYPSPGKVLWNSGSGSLVRALREHRGVLYAVIDNFFYSYDSAGNRTLRGTLGTFTSAVEISNISNQLSIVDGTNFYNYNTDTNTFAAVPDVDAPTNTSTTAGQDEIVFACSANSRVVQGSAVGDGLSWDPLSFNSKSYAADYIVKLVSLKSRLWVIGEYTTEVWYNSGATTFSFEIVPGSGIEYGCAAKQSVATTDSDIYMLGRSKRGGLTVLSMNNESLGSAKPIANQSIIYQINQLTTTSDAIGYCYEIGGHLFYMLTFPTEDISFEYDITSDCWQERTSLFNGTYGRDFGNCYAYCYGKHFVGDCRTGNILYLSTSNYQENGVNMLRQIVTPPAYAEGKKVWVHKLQIDTETDVGSNLTVTLDVSRDSGHTYVDSYTNTVPSAGGRMYWMRLGMTQNAFVFKISTTVNAKFVILGAWADVSVGTH